MVYFIADGEDCVKIGKADNVKQRLRDLQVGNPRDLEILRVIDIAGSDIEKQEFTDYDVEHELHVFFKDYRIQCGNKIKTEWFLRSGVNFLFEKTDEELMLWIKELLQANVSLRVYKIDDAGRDTLQLEKRLKKAQSEINFLRSLLDRKNKYINEQSDRIFELEDQIAKHQTQAKE